MDDDDSCVPALPSPCSLYAGSGLLTSAAAANGAAAAGLRRG